MATSTIGNAQPAILQGLQQFIQERGGGEIGIKSGVSGTSQATPLPDTAGTATGADYAATFQALFSSASLSPRRRADMEVVLAEVSAALKETRDRTEGERITTNQEKIRAAQNTEQEKLAERSEKIDDSIAQQAKADRGSRWKRFFQFVGLAIAVAMLSTVSGGVLGALMLAAVAVQAYMVTDDIVAEKTGTSIAGHMMKGLAFLSRQFDNVLDGIADKLGAELKFDMKLKNVDDLIEKIDNGMGWALMGVSLALAFVTVGASMASGAATASAKAVEFADDAVSFAGQATKFADEAVAIAGKASQFADEAAAFSTNATQFADEAATFSAKMAQMADDIAAGTATMADYTDDITAFTARMQQFSDDAAAFAARAAEVSDDLAGFADEAAMFAREATAMRATVANFASDFSGDFASLERQAAVLGKYTAVAEIANTVGEVTAGTVTTVTSVEAQRLQADAERLKADADKIQAAMANFEALVDEALKLLMNAQDVSNAMLDSAVSALAARNDALMRTRFAG